MSGQLLHRRAAAVMGIAVMFAVGAVFLFWGIAASATSTALESAPLCTVRAQVPCWNDQPATVLSAHQGAGKQASWIWVERGGQALQIFTYGAPDTVWPYLAPGTSVVLREAGGTIQDVRVSGTDVTTEDSSGAQVLVDYMVAAALLAGATGGLIWWMVAKRGPLGQPRRRPSSPTEGIALPR
ncbi:MAG: hypothetical protein ACYDAC_01465 [Candidatus Dormibacteria bacterium]